MPRRHTRRRCCTCRRSQSGSSRPLIDAAESPFHPILPDDALRHRRTSCRSGTSEDQRYRQPKDGHSYPERQGTQGPGCHAHPKLLEALRVYWCGLRRKPTDWPVPGNRWHTAGYPVSPRSSGRPVSRPPNAPVLSTSTSIPRLWPATFFDAASDPIAAAFKKRLPRTTNDVCHFQRRPAHALCVCSSCPLIVSASSGLSTTLRCRITSEQIGRAHV